MNGLGLHPAAPFTIAHLLTTANGKGRLAADAQLLLVPRDVYAAVRWLLTSSACLAWAAVRARRGARLIGLNAAAGPQYLHQIRAMSKSARGMSDGRNLEPDISVHELSGYS